MVQRLEAAIDTGPHRGGTAPDPGFTAGRFALLFGLLIFAAFPQVLLGLQTFVVRDFGFFSYPVAQYQRECFWRGELPLWNPLSHCGLPFLAQWNTMPLYPPALIYLLLPLNWSLSFFCLLHLFWGGLGMYFLARRWTGSLLAASVAGLIFGFNGFSLSLLMWPSHIATLSWMPWVVLATGRASLEGGRRIVAAALVGALQMLAGGPETIFFTWLICLVLWMTHVTAFWKEHGLSAVRNRLWRFPLVVLLVAGLSAAQLFPFLDLAAHSQREAGFADARWSMPKWGWLNLLVPMLFGTIGKQGLFFQNSQGWTSSYYLGIGAILLALVGLSTVRKPRVWLLSAAALLGLILATGDQTALSSWARRLLPQLSLMTYPIKFVTVTVFAVPLLAGFGVNHLSAEGEDPAAKKRLMVITVGLVVVIAAALIFICRYPQPGENPASVIVRNGLSRGAFLVGALALIWAMMRAPERWILSGLSNSQHLLPLLLLVLFWLDVWTHMPRQNPAVPAWVYAENIAVKKLELNPKPALGESRLMVSPAAQRKFLGFVLEDPKDNYLVKRLGFFADCNLLDSVPKVDGFFSLCPRECGELNSALYVSGVPFGSGLLDFLSVSQLTAPGEVNWTRRDTWLPLLTAGQQPVFLDDTNALLTSLSSGFDPRKTVLLPPDSTLSATSMTNGVNTRVSLRRFAPHQIEAQVDADGPTIVVIGQTYYHRWRAYIDGQPARLLRANYAFQALAIPAGVNQIELKYEDPAFHAGALVSGFAFCACIIGWFFPQRRFCGALAEK